MTIRSLCSTLIAVVFKTSGSLAFASTILTAPVLHAEQPNVRITIRAFGALTGPVKSFGIDSRAALQAASRRIDEAGGVRLHDGSVGHFVIQYDDDHCNPEDGIALLKEAADSDALAVIGPSCSSVAEPLYGALQHHAGDANDRGFQIPVFTDGATKADLARISDWAFRDSPNERDMYQALWKWVRTNRPDLKTMFSGEEADFAHSHSTLQNIIASEASGSGLTVLGDAKWSIHDTSFAAPAGEIKEANADVVVISAHALTTCGVLRELAHQNYRPKLLVGLTSASTPETLEQCGREAEGLVIPTSFIANTPELQNDADAVAAAGGIADLHSMSAWEILYTLKQVLESSDILPSSATVATDRERLRVALSHLQTIQGVMGTITRTSDRESLKPFVLAQVVGGKWKVLPDPGLVLPKRSNAEETFRIPFGNSGLRLFVRHLPPSTMPQGAPRSVLFVHGATFPSALAAAYQFGGRSWMEDLSAHGFDTWALDFMGYGGSDRYPSMTDASLAHAPLLRTQEAAEQIAAACNFIRKQRGISTLSVIAHSWGTLPAGLFATQNADTLDRLVLFGPPAKRHESTPDSHTWPLAWDVTVAEQMDRFRGYLPKGERPVLDEADMDRWGKTYLASDPTSGSRVPPSVHVPYGPIADVDLAWAGEFPYQPERIMVPVLIVRGEWDEVTRDEDANWLYTRLVNAPIRRDVRISRGTHVMHLEESRFQLYREVQTFLEGEIP